MREAQMMQSKRVRMQIQCHFRLCAYGCCSRFFFERRANYSQLVDQKVSVVYFLYFAYTKPTMIFRRMLKPVIRRP